MSAALLESIAEQKQKILDARAKLKEDSKAFFKDGSKFLFDNYPDLKSFAWRQYTPYFNDGDACNFNCYAEYADINGLDSDDDSDNSVFDTEMYKAVIEFLSAFDEEMMEDMFGDHCYITVTSDNVEIEEYHHD